MKLIKLLNLIYIFCFIIIAMEPGENDFSLPEEFFIELEKPYRLKQSVIIDKISSLSKYYFDIIRKTEYLEINPENILVCFDIDDVTTKPSTNIPLEGEITKQIYEDLSKRGYNLVMVTSRNHNINEENKNLLTNWKNELYRNVFDNSKNWMGEDKLQEFTMETAERSPQTFYWLKGLLYAGMIKDEILYNFLPNLERLSAYRPHFQAIFMVDDQENNLKPFIYNNGLKEYFGENIFLYHFTKH